MVTNREFLELQLKTYIEMSVARMFHQDETSKEFTRESLIILLRDVVTKSIDMYREDFAEGMRKTLAHARLNSLIRGEHNI